MARRTFQVIDVMEVLQHWHAGRPKTVVAASLGVDVKTVRKHVAAAEAAGIRPGDGLVSDRAGWAVRVAGWFPELVDAQARSRTWPELEGRRELIAKMLDTNTLATVHQRLRDEHGLSASESSLRRFVGQAFPDRRGARLVPVLRPGAPVGEAQIDQPGLCRDGRALRLPDRPRSGSQAKGQAPGRASDAVRAGLVLARPQLRQPDRHADPGNQLGAAPLE